MQCFPFGIKSACSLTGFSVIYNSSKWLKVNSLSCFDNLLYWRILSCFCELNSLCIEQCAESKRVFKHTRITHTTSSVCEIKYDFETNTNVNEINHIKVKYVLILRVRRQETDRSD